MMLSYPVLLGFVWSLLFHSSNGQPQTSNQDNKVYAYSYHFIHNGTTNSKDILRSVLGTDPELGFNNDGKSILKTISGPGIRGFFTKGILPAGPISRGFNSDFRSNFKPNPAIQNIRDVIQSNLQPPPSTIARGILPPVSPDIRNEFPGDFNNVNDIGINYHKQDDFPKIPSLPSLPVFQNQDNFPKIPPVSTISSLNQNNFPEIPPPPPIPSFNVNHQPIIPNSHQLINNNNGINKIENFERNTQDGGKVVGQLETFSYNPPPLSSPNSNHQENAQGFRRNENFISGNREVTGHRTQSYFRQQFRTVTPNLDTNNLFQNNGIGNPNVLNSRNNNENQWWNALNVFGGINNISPIKNENKENSLNKNQNRQNLGSQIDQNINKIKENVNKEFNRAFGSRLSNSNYRQNYAHNNNQFRAENEQNDFNNQNRNLNNQNINLNNQNINLNNQNINLNNQNRNLNNQNNNNKQIPRQNEKLQPLVNIPFNNQVISNNFNQHGNNGRFANNQRHDNIIINPPQNHNLRPTNNGNNNVLNNNRQNLNNQFNNDDTTRKVLGLINDVSSRLNNNPERFTNDIGITWDDLPSPKTFNHDWSRRQSFGSDRPFSNGHSGPLSNQANLKPFEEIKTSIDAVIGGRDIPINPIRDSDGGNSYRNNGGGGYEKFFNVNKVMEGPNSFSQNQRQGFERNFNVNSNSGYQRTNQWSRNIVRRLDAQSTRDDFSKDFIDVFREDY